MTIALWCVLICGLLPFACALIAKSDRNTFDNHNPREWLARQQGWRARAHAAQQNSWEAFVFFAACVFSSYLAAGPLPSVDILAVAFVAGRLIYILCYVTDRATLRSLVWFVCLGLALAIFLAGV